MSSIKNIQTLILVTFALVFSLKTSAQVIDLVNNKGTIYSVNNNNVTTSPTEPSAPVENDIWFDTSVSPTIIRIHNGGTDLVTPLNNWNILEHTGTPGSVFFAGSTGSLTEDNAQLFWNETNNSFFIGNTLDKSTNTDKLNVSGVIRSTLGIKNNNGTEGLPSYRFNSDGDTGIYRGSLADHLNLTTGGVNAIAIDNDQQVGIGVADANSTLQIEGSVAKSIFTTTTALTLTDEHHTIILGGNHNITLPAAGLSTGRVYVIKNNTANTPVIDAYLDLEGNSPTTIPAESVLWLQSNGTAWEQISSSKGSATVVETITTATQAAGNELADVSAGTARTIATYTSENNTITNINETITNLTDTNNGFVTFTNEAGAIQTVAKADITANTDGTYTFSNNDGTDVTIDTNGIVISNVIAGNRIATVTELDGTAVDIDETITTATQATGNADAQVTAGTARIVATFTSEDGTATDINETITNLTDTNNGFVTFTNEAGAIQTVAKADITANTDGTYTFSNNDGTDVTIDTNGIVISNVIAGNRIATVTELDGTAVDIDETITTASQAAGNADAQVTAGTARIVATYTNENGDDVNINETITTASQATGNEAADVTADNARTIATYTNENGDDVNINETITTASQALGNEAAEVSSGDARTIATYTNENGDDVNINETITSLTQDDTPTSSDPTATGEITFTDEEGNTTGKAQVVSADTDNNIQVGTDGGAYFASPVIYAAGRNISSGSQTAYNSELKQNAQGEYSVVFDTPIGSSNYIIQLTPENCPLSLCPNGQPNVEYTNLSPTGFDIVAGDGGNGATSMNLLDIGFMFTVIKLPDSFTGATSVTTPSGPGVPTGNPTTNISLNGELADQFNFQLNFNENVAGSLNGQTWEILISNVDYEFFPTTTGASAGNPLVYTTSKVQNADLTWNHLITSTSTISGSGLISGSVPSPAGSCNGGSCSNATTVTFYLVP